MPKQSPSSSSIKRKHAGIEGRFDSDSDEELDVDVGMLVDGHGQARKTCTVHVSQIKRKHANSLPGSLLKPACEPPGNNSSLKEKRKQVCGIF